MCLSGLMPPPASRSPESFTDSEVLSFLWVRCQELSSENDSNLSGIYDGGVEKDIPIAFTASYKNGPCLLFQSVLENVAQI